MKDIRVSFPKPCREDWNEMTPEGRNRFCGECSKTIHDLRRYRWDEVDALLRSGEEVCVRAEIGKSDVVALRSDSMRKVGRIIATISASVGLASLSAPVFAGKRGPEGTIAGKVDYAWPQILVTATSADGTKHISKTNWKGRYKIKHLPPGSYKIAFYDGETDWVGPDAVVEDRKTAIRDTENPNPPIIVGMIQVELNGG